MVEWFWWDSSLFSTTNWFPSGLWHCWFGHLACKNRPRLPEMTYYVSIGTLNLTHSHSSMWNWKKAARSRWTCSGIRVPRALGLSNHKLKSVLKCTVCTTHTRPRRTNIMIIARRFVPGNASHVKKYLERSSHHTTRFGGHMARKKEKHGGQGTRFRPKWRSWVEE